MSNNIIISTPNLYVEIPVNYEAMSIVLVAVSSFEALAPSKEVKGSGIRESIRGFLRPKEDTGYRSFSRKWSLGGNTDWRSLLNSDSSDDDSLQVSEVKRVEILLYEVRMAWDWGTSEQGESGKEAMVGTHAMSLAAAREEKQSIERQLAAKCSTIKMVEKFLKNPGSVAEGLIGNEFEREVSKTVYKFLNG